MNSEENQQFFFGGLMSCVAGSLKMYQTNKKIVRTDSVENDAIAHPHQAEEGAVIYIRSYPLYNDFRFDWLSSGLKVES